MGTVEPGFSLLSNCMSAKNRKSPPGDADLCRWDRLLLNTAWWQEAHSVRPAVLLPQTATSGREPMPKKCLTSKTSIQQGLEMANHSFIISLSSECSLNIQSMTSSVFLWFSLAEEKMNVIWILSQFTDQ